jgi:hypothetical protein
MYADDDATSPELITAEWQLWEGGLQGEKKGDDDDDGDGDASDAGVEPRERATRWERRTTTMRGARGGEDGSDARGGGERRGTRATGDDEARDERAGRARLGERTGRGTVETDDGG